MCGVDARTGHLYNVTMPSTKTLAQVKARVRELERGLIRACLEEGFHRAEAEELLEQKALIRQILSARASGRGCFGGGADI